MLWRYFDGSYDVGGAFVEGAALRSIPGGPSALGFASFSPFHMTCHTLVFLGVCNGAFFAHGTVPRYFAEMTKTDDGTLADQSRFHNVAVGSFLFSGILYSIVALLGTWTFCGSHYTALVGEKGIGLASLVLNNYAAHDVLMQFAVIFLIPPVIASFASQFVGLKDSLQAVALRHEDLLVSSRFARFFVVSKSRSTGRTLLRNGLLSCIVMALCGLFGLVAPSLDKVIAVRGAFLGAVFIFVVPAGLCIRLGKEARFKKRERFFSKVIFFYGMTSAILGTAVAVWL